MPSSKDVSCQTTDSRMNVEPAFFVANEDMKNLDPMFHGALIPVGNCLHFCEDSFEG